MESVDFLGTISKLIKRADQASRVASGQTSGKRAFFQFEPGTRSQSSGNASVHETTGVVSVRWKEHGEFLLRSIADFFDQGCLADADVTCGKDSLRVHRLILAAFLPTFRNSLDVAELELSFDGLSDNFEDVRAVIQFIYTGTLTVSESRVDDLRRLAKVLRFQGLADALSTDIEDEPNDEREASDGGMVIKVEPGLVPYVESGSNDCSMLDGEVVGHSSMGMPIITKIEEEQPSREDDVLADVETLVKEPADADDSDMVSEPSDHTSVPFESDEDDSEDCSGKYVCKLCNKCFTEANYLGYHVSDFHKHWKPFRCQPCRKVFSEVQHLRGHFNQTHKDWKPCRRLRSTCVGGTAESPGEDVKKDDTNVEENDGESHVLVAKYACALCDEPFDDECTIRCHADDVHVHWKPFACGSCSLTFAHVGRLRLHLSTVHGVPQLLRCEVCPKTFMRRARLKRHVERFHDAYMRFECQLCGTKCANERNVHEVRRTRSCHSCRVALTSHDGLRRRVDVVHDKVRRYRCRSCDARFLDRKGLNRHVKNVHKGGPPPAPISTGS